MPPRLTRDERELLDVIRAKRGLVISEYSRGGRWAIANSLMKKGYVYVTSAGMTSIGEKARFAPRKFKRRSTRKRVK